MAPMIIYFSSMRRLLCAAAFAAMVAAAQQPKQAPGPYVPKPEEVRQIESKSAELGALLSKLEGNALQPDVAVYRKAGEFILRHPEEFANAGFVKDTLNVLDRGIA